LIVASMRKVSAATLRAVLLTYPGAIKCWWWTTVPVIDCRRGRKSPDDARFDSLANNPAARRLAARVVPVQHEFVVFSMPTHVQTTPALLVGPRATGASSPFPARQGRQPAQFYRAASVNNLRLSTVALRSLELYHCRAGATSALRRSGVARAGGLTSTLQPGY
jgi:hypothetical protein